MSTRYRCCEAECPEHPAAPQQAAAVARRAVTGLRALAWWAVRSVMDR